MSSLRRLLRIVLVTLLAAEALYLLLANGALLLLPHVLNRQPDRAYASFQAFTPIPGYVVLRNFTLRSQDRWNQWQLQVGQARLWVWLPDLVKSKFRVTEIDASGVGFRIRRKLKPWEATKATLAAQPEIPGFGRYGRWEPDAFPWRPQHARTWTLQMDQVDAKAKELWVDTLRYSGPVQASGSWWLHFDHEAEVGPAHAELQGGAVTRGKVPVLGGLKGPLDVHIQPFLVRALPARGVLAQLGAKGELHARIPRPAALAGAFAPLGAVQARGVPGRLDAKLDVEGGTLRPGTRADVSLPSMSIAVAKLHLRGAAKLHAVVTKKKLIRVEARAAGLTLHDGIPDALVRDGALRLVAYTRSRPLAELQPPRRARVRLTGARLADISLLNAYVPEPLKLQLLRGDARLTGDFKLDLTRRTASGALYAHVEQLAVRQRGDELRGALAVELKLPRLDPALRRIELSGSRVRLTGMHAPNAPGRPWRVDVGLERASLVLGRKEVFQGTVRANFDDARPVFRTVLTRAHVPRWASKLLAPDEVRGQAQVGLGPGWVRVDGLEARVGRTHLTAAAHLGRSSRGAVARISAGPLSLGVVTRDEDPKVHLLARQKWFEDRVAELPARAEPRS